MPLTQQVPPIARGYPYPLQLHVTCDDAPFAAGAVIVGQLRDYPGGPLAGQLSTADGSLYVDDDHTIELQIPASISARLANTSAAVDFVRIDQAANEWLGLQLRLPVLAPVTVFAAVAGSDSSTTTLAGTNTALIVAPPGWVVRLQRCAWRPPAIPIPTPSPNVGSVLGTASTIGTSVVGLAALVAQFDQFATASLAHFAHMGA